MAATTTEATMRAIQESLVQLNMKLGRIAARQNKMLLDMQMTAAVVPTATTTPTFMPDRAREQTETKPLPPSLISTHLSVVAGASHADTVLAPTMPARCSMLGSDVKMGNNSVVGAFLTSGVTHLPATTSTGAGNDTPQAVGGAGVNTPAGCSTHVFTCPLDNPGVHARAFDNNTQCGPLCQAEEHRAGGRPSLPPAIFPRFEGKSPRCWRDKCLEFFKIHRSLWVIAATLHMDGDAKAWYETYRLKQPVDDWSQFMHAVEANFGAGDLYQELKGQLNLFAKPIMDVSPLVFDRMPIKTHSKEKGDTLDVPKLFDDMPVCVSRSDSKPQDTHEQPNLRDVIQLVESIAHDSDEIITQVGGVSLFLELVVESVDGVLTATHIKDVVWDEQFADPVITHIEGLPFFLEEGLSFATLVLVKVSPCHGNPFTSDIVDVSAKDLVF